MRGILIGAGLGVVGGLLYRHFTAGASAVMPGVPGKPFVPTGGAPATPVKIPAPPSEPVYDSKDAFFGSLSSDPVMRTRQLYNALKFKKVPYELSFSNVTVTDGKNSAVVQVTSDALKIFGVRINVDQYYGQLICDMLGCCPMTRRVAVAAWQQAKYKPAPTTMDITATTKGMLQASAGVDEKLAKLGWTPGDKNLVGNPGKDWLLNSWFWLPGRNNQFCKHAGMSGAVKNIESAVNYGFFQADGTPIQNVANCHDFHHTDYSQIQRMLGPITQLVVSGVAIPFPTMAMFTHPEYSKLLLDDGPLKGHRHPGVPMDEDIKQANV